MAPSCHDISYVPRFLDAVDRPFRVARARQGICCHRRHGDDDFVLAYAQVLPKISFFGAGATLDRWFLSFDDVVVRVSLLARQTIPMER